MAALWPWLALAGLGALHGLSPANGWMFAAACGVQARDATQVRRALLPIAAGHAGSIAVVAGAIAQGASMDRTWAQPLAGALLIGVASCRWLAGAGQRAPVSAPAGHTGLALWSFLMATAQGAGLMLMPALVPLCLAGNPAREITASGSLVLAAAAVGVHTAAMLLTTGVIATGVLQGVLHGAARHPRLLSGAAPRHAWTVALAAAGALLLVLR